MNGDKDYATFLVKSNECFLIKCLLHENIFLTNQIVCPAHDITGSTG